MMLSNSNSHGSQHSSWKENVFWLSGLGLVSLLLVFAYWKPHDRAEVWQQSGGSPQGVPGRAPARRPFFAKGLRTPRTHPAADAPVGDQETIIGIATRGKARAYRLDAMQDRYRHIINDIIDDEPVSVTYSDMNGCIRGFVGTRRGEPLELAHAGLLGDSMLIKIRDATYVQDSGKPVEFDPETTPPPFPYAEIPLTRTTWGEWRKLHPDTDIYLGD